MKREDVQKHPVDLGAVAGAEFAQVRLDVILVIAMQEIEKLPRADPGGNGGRPVTAELSPVRMARGGVFFPADRGVDRRADAVAVQGFDLFAQQVTTPERRMRGADLRGEITHPVVTFREDGHAVDASLGKGAGELVGVKVARHTVRDQRRSVKIQVNLPLGWRAKVSSGESDMFTNMKRRNGGRCQRGRTRGKEGKELSVRKTSQNQFFMSQASRASRKSCHEPWKQNTLGRTAGPLVPVAAFGSGHAF